MSYILPLTADEIERRLLAGADVTIHEAKVDNNLFKVELNYTIETGAELKFRAPEAASAASKLCVSYKNSDRTSASADFIFADANGNNVGNVDNLFAKNAVVKVILDLEQEPKVAFVQNADTNKYLEDRLTTLTAKDTELTNRLTTHLAKQDNPHKVTAEQIGAITAETLEDALSGVDFGVGRTTIAGGEVFNDYTNNEANGQNSHAEGVGTVASCDAQHVQGRWNYIDKNGSAGDYAHIVGNGTKDNRMNAHTLDWDGNAWYNGQVNAEKGFVLTRGVNFGTAQDMDELEPTEGQFFIKIEE